MATLSFKQASILSFASIVMARRHDEEVCPEDMTDEELRQTLCNITIANQILKLENDIFERYLTRHDPQSLERVAKVMEAAKQEQRKAAMSKLTAKEPVAPSWSGSVLSLREKSTPSNASVRSTTVSKYVSPGRLMKRMLKVPILHRIDIGNIEIEEMKKKVTDLRKVVRRTRKIFRAELEETEFRIRETDEARGELEENIAKKGVDPITGRIPAEKFVRFIEEWLKGADVTMERIRMKTSSVRGQILKAKQQLAQREELGEDLRPIDFEKLAIENKDCLKKIEEKNRSLLVMKKITGFYGIELTKHKEKLNGLISRFHSIKKEITVKQNQIDKFHIDHAIAKEEVDKMQEDVDSLVHLINTYEAPDILDFVKLRTELEGVQKLYKRLQRRKNILQITYGSQEKSKHLARKTDDDDQSRKLSRNLSQVRFSM